MASLSTSIEYVPRINRKIVPALKRLGIFTVQDLLFHFPARYDDFSHQKSIADVHADDVVTVRGKIEKINLKRIFKRRMSVTEAVIRDDTGTIDAVWFNQPFLATTLKPGDSVYMSGKAVLRRGGPQLQSPVYEKISSRIVVGAGAQVHTGRLVAVYPETLGITSRWLRFLIAQFLPLRSRVADPLPEEVRVAFDLLPVADALRAVHTPETLEEADTARRRFAFEELFLIQLHALREKFRLKGRFAPEIPADIEGIKRFVQSLPFTLTDAQRRSIWEIAKDMAKPHPMNRLLEGDVGSGKTVVGAVASLLCVKAGYQAAVMAPTEILAQQHFQTMSKLLEPLGVTVGLVTSASKSTRIPGAGNRDVTIGTHALIQKTMRFERLGLVLVDEQHRFGVEQRAALLRKSSFAKASEDKQEDTSLIPHFLSMSATPIPRTLALTVYGDLDLSILDEMPKAWKQIITKVIDPKRREEAYEFIREEVKKGRQVFVVCPRIDIESPSFSARVADTEGRQEFRKYQTKFLFAEVKAVKEEYKKLSEIIFPDFRVAMLHGKMKPKEKEMIMQSFRNHEADILVSTSVIEVGVDVPNAAIMMIEGAERFGLATLHQFRGRVGRGSEQSYCFLFPTEAGAAATRLRAVVEAKNGFELAEKDMQIRGPGDLLGTRQSGISVLLLRALADPVLVRSVREAAVRTIKQSPDLKKYPALHERLTQMKNTVHGE